MAVTLGRRARHLLLAAAVAASSGLARDARAYSQAFFCFFDKGDAEPTVRCLQVVDAFVQRWKAERDGTLRSYQPPFEPMPAVERRVVVAGHAQDDPASPGADQRLSVDRAARVAALLERAGVPRRLITAQGFGNRQLLVPEPDNVQNRRIEIIAN